MALSLLSFIVTATFSFSFMSFSLATSPPNDLLAAHPKEGVAFKRTRGYAPRNTVIVTHMQLGEEGANQM